MFKLIGLFLICMLTMIYGCETITLLKRNSHIENDMNTKITKKQLIDLSTCADILDRFIEQTNNTDKPVEITSLIGGKSTTVDLVWLACHIFSRREVVAFALDCSRSVEYLNPNPRVVSANNLVQHWLDGENVENDDLYYAYTETLDDSYDVFAIACKAAGNAAFAAYSASAYESLANLINGAAETACTAKEKEDVDVKLVKLFSGGYA